MSLASLNQSDDNRSPSAFEDDFGIASVNNKCGVDAILEGRTESCEVKDINGIRIYTPKIKHTGKEDNIVKTKSIKVLGLNLYLTIHA